MNRLRLVFDTLDDGVCLLDGEGRVEMVNAAALDLLRRTESELLGRTAGELMTFGGAAPSLDERLASGQSCRDEAGELTTGDGRRIPVVFSLGPIGHDGEAAGSVLRFRDASAAQFCDLALRESEMKLHAILDAIVDGVIAIDRSGIIQLVNPAAEVLFGYRAAELLGRNVRMLMPSPDREAHDQYLANYLTTGVRKIIGIGREVLGLRKDGSEFPLYLSVGEARDGARHWFVAVIHDLTRRKHVEQQLHMLSSAVQQSPSAVLIANLEGTIEYVNPSFTRLTGYTAEEAVGRNPSLLRAPHTTPEQYRRLWQTLLSGGIWQEEIQDRKKCGDLYWALESISPIRNEKGEITHFLAIQQDITEQKEARETLRESEERFRQVAEMTGEWIWEQDPEGRYIYSSGAVREILGYEPDEILGKRYLDLMTDEDRQHWSGELAPTPDIQQRFYRLVNRYRHRDGHEVFTESTGEPIVDRSGRVVKWRGVDHNITVRKRFEDALRLRDRAIEAANVGINIADATEENNPNIYVNPALSRMTGYSREELLGRNMRQLQGPDTDPAVVQEIGRALREGRHCEVVLKNYRKDGTPFWNDLLISPVRDDEGRLTHFIGIQTDVTEKRRAEEQRRELEIAKQIQLSLLPKGPLHVAGARVAGICLPAADVGGDYFDFFQSSADTLDMLIADVSGHSVGAALVMAELRSALKAETLRLREEPVGHSVPRILRTLNELLFEDLNNANLFISMFYLRYHTTTRQLYYTNGGHNRPLLMRVGAERCEPLDTEGMILGVRRNVEFEVQCETLNAGDALALYTDGITEAQDAAGEFFGESRLCELLSRHRRETPEHVIEKILAALRDHCAGDPFNDDISLVVLRAE